MNEIEKAKILLFNAELDTCVTMEDRVIFLLTLLNNQHGHWKLVSEKTQISSKRWRKVIAKEQRITSDMLQGLCRWLPEYTYWIVTGYLPASELEHAKPIFNMAKMKSYL